MAGRPKGLPKTGGRQKGAVNKTTKALKDMILGALDKAGGEDYLQRQADENPSAFMTLIGKVLPSDLKVTSPDGSLGPQKVEITLVKPKVDGE